MRLAFVVAVCAGCGRLGFDVSPDEAAIVPSNRVEWPDVALGPLSITAAATISTDDGSIVEAGTGRVIRAAGSGLVGEIWFESAPAGGVFAMSSFDTSDLVIVRGTRPLILLVESDVSIAAELRLRGGDLDVTDPGPGGDRGGTSEANPAMGCGAGGVGRAFDCITTGDDSDGGGAGGSYGTASGAGSTHMLSGVATTPCGTPELEPLVGGSGGGAGGVYQQFVLGGRGGGGGGAIQITSGATILVSGTIDAGGGGGENGRVQPPVGATDWGGGGGGGAGGGILLEAPVVVIDGIVAANGGGGGGDVGNGTAERGGMTTVPAAGGGNVIRGGAGCTSLAAARPGADIVNGRDAAGGGGGCGRIRFNSASPSINGIVSPVPFVGAIKVRR